MQEKLPSWAPLWGQPGTVEPWEVSGGGQEMGLGAVIPKEVYSTLSAELGGRDGR